MSRRKILIILGIMLIIAGGIWITHQFHALALAQGQATYVGIDKCGACHPKNLNAYKKAKYGMAWKVLKMRGRSDDPACVRCHVTGYGKTGGFIDEKTTPYLEDKQCESCHGPGSDHVADPSNMEARKIMNIDLQKFNVCVECHAGHKHEYTKY